MTHEHSPSGGEAMSYADFQQRRGRLPDLIEEALDIYRDFMRDDDFDTQRCLDRIAEKLKSARDFYDATPKPTGLEAAQDERMARALRLRAEMDGPDMPGGYYRQRADSIIFALAAHSVVPSEGMREALARLVSEDVIYLTGAEQRADEVALFVTVGDVIDARAALRTDPAGGEG